MEVGDKFGEWTVLEILSSRKCVARCQCGNEKEVYISNLTSGKSTNCGCIQRIKNHNRMTTHGQSKTKLYNVWAGIKRRCYNPNQKSYVDYGGRGIRMCDEWKENFDIFYEWAISNGYQEGKVEIDRIDVNGHYTPTNCRWITKKKNTNNKRNNYYIEYRGEIKTASELGEEFGLSPNTIIKRLNNGWDIEKALMQPYKNGDGKFKPMYIELNGKKMTFEEISKEYGIKLNTIKSRYRRGLRGIELIQRVVPLNKEKPILCYDLEGNFIKEFSSIKEGSKEMGVSTSSIRENLNGKVKPKKYIWKLKEEK